MPHTHPSPHPSSPSSARADEHAQTNHKREARDNAHAQTSRGMRNSTQGCARDNEHGGAHDNTRLAAPPDKRSNIRSAKIGIIGAMGVEVATLAEAMGDVRLATHAGTEFREGTIGATRVVVVQCNVGMVNAALCAQVLINCFDVTHIVNTGVAGATVAHIGRGDVVIATDAVNHLMDVCNLGYQPGQTPGLSTYAFPCDHTLGARIEAAVHDTTSAPVYRGRIASGDRFVRDASEKERIAQVFDALCCEMEGAAIAQVCHLNGIPCAIVRAISDKADGSDAIDYPTFEAHAAATCAAIVKRFVEQWD